MIKATPRLWAIWKVTRRYGLSEFWGGKPSSDSRPRGERLRLALQELGPVFIKFGQALSTRPDIVPVDVATELAKLQDQVEPFPGAEARAIIERSLGKPIAELFHEFDETPLAAASVAQVHTARLKPQDDGDPGFEVVVKVLRPGVMERVEKDVALLRALAEFAERWHPLGKRLRPREVVAEYEKVIFDELDLMREGANCSLLRRNWLGSELIYHPIVFWDFTRSNVLVMERIHGVSLRHLDQLREMGVNFQVLAERGVEIFFKQVFRDNFFHADMHPGNIFVDVSDVRKPSYLAVDFGIVGQLSPADLRYLAENFLAFFNRDYRRIAELHLESGWIPADVRAEDFESAIRTVSEPIFGKPIKDISFGVFLLRLFEIARRFNYQVQPQLVLLQKTLLTTEGLGRQLYPELDLWKTAKPIMEQWMWNRINPAATFARLRKEGPQLAEALPELAQNAMKFLAKGGALPSHTLDASGVEALRSELRASTRKSLHAAIGGTAWVAGVALYGMASLNAATPSTSVVVASLLFAGVGLWGWVRAFR
ncbi:ubiquinone biosynthesis regulatory protein kinase UbiB [Nevskia ramosa]|uniref:ubiquinone biosynthesis regulatory protein kinase UbiB n=1 Tax=Nevskia ramosa TaxID=64002 RepID=UPI0003B61B43|nr:ubiquinone biosynthesis regulatory protein kinase UbiB [Nevskia ramosa]